MLMTTTRLITLPLAHAHGVMTIHLLSTDHTFTQHFDHALKIVHAIHHVVLSALYKYILMYYVLYNTHHKM